tara:strand:- start:452 stop:670 length:219 start_codon:yes stop_codon:yes gene_type:complete
MLILLSYKININPKIPTTEMQLIITMKVKTESLTRWPLACDSCVSFALLIFFALVYNLNLTVTNGVHLYPLM